MNLLRQGFWRLGAASVWLSLLGCGETTDSCHIVATTQAVSERIVSGSPDVPDTFAATGALLIATQQGTGPLHTRLCTATLIAADAVITAAHCRADYATMGFWQNDQPLMQNPTHMQPKDPTLRGAQRAKREQHVWYSFCLLSAVSPAAGVTQNGSAQCTPATTFDVHPDYHLPGPWDVGLVDAYDVGVLHLAHPMKRCMPARLLRPGEHATLAAGQAVLIAGYGSTIDHAALGRIAQASGIKRFAHSQIGKLSAAEMTVGEPPCPAHKSFGDSGGPTFIQTPDGPKLVGVTSRLQAEADAGFGTVDTRLDTVADWVFEAAGITRIDADEDVDDADITQGH